MQEIYGKWSQNDITVFISLVVYIFIQMKINNISYFSWETSTSLLTIEK
jgi:hypothetical protein